MFSEVNKLEAHCDVFFFRCINGFYKYTLIVKKYCDLFKILYTCLVYIQKSIYYLN